MSREARRSKRYCIYPMRIAYFFAMVLIFGSCNQQQEEREQQRMMDYLLKGSLALEKMQFVDAMGFVDSASAISPSDANVLFLRARVLSELGKYEEAEESYLKVKEADAHYRGVWSNLGNNSFRQQNFKDAVAFYQRELAENDTSYIAWRGLGRAFGELGVSDSAHIAFDMAIQFNPEFAGSYYSKSRLMESEGDFENALKLALEAFTLAPDNEEYGFHYGAVLVKNNREEEAIPVLMSVIEKWPWHNGALYNLGQAYARLGQQEKAKEYLEKAEKARERQAKVALQEQSVVSFGDDPLAYARLGAALRISGRYDDALKAYKVALNLAPDMHEVENNVANIYLIKGDTLKAIQHYQAIVEKNPTLVDVWMNLGVVQALSGNTSAAKQAWEHALRHDPSNQQARAYIVRLERQKDNR